MKKGRPRLAPLQTCPVCKESFYRPPSQLAAGYKSCSRACGSVLRRRDRIERRCQQCGKSFAARAGQVAKGFGLYCSNRCNGLATMNRIDTSCRWCSAPLSIPSWLYHKWSRHFCDRDCKKAWLQRFGTRKGVNAFTSEQKALWLEDRCCRCGATEKLELDHIVPRFAGGKAIRENAQTLCRKCNREKFWNEDLPKYERNAQQLVAG